MIFDDFINKYLPIMTKVAIQANSEILIFDGINIHIKPHYNNLSTFRIEMHSR